MHNRKYYFHQMIHNNDFEQQIKGAILKLPDEKETISIKELERWVAEDKERRLIKNRIGRIV